MDTKRLILFVVFSFSILLLWDTWQRKHTPVAEVATQQDASVPSSQKLNSIDTKTIALDSNFKLETGSRIKVVTDLYQIEIDTVGGDIRRLLLNNHLADNAQDKFVLLDDSQKPLFYVAQTGLIGNDLPTHKSIFTSEKTNYVFRGIISILNILWATDNQSSRNTNDKFKSWRYSHNQIQSNKRFSN